MWNVLYRRMTQFDLKRGLVATLVLDEVTLTHIILQHHHSIIIQKAQICNKSL